MTPRVAGWATGAVTVGVVAALVDAFGGGRSGPWRVAGIAVNTVVLGGILGLIAGVAAARIAGGARGRDGAERLLAFATTGLPPSRAEWGVAMHAESIDDPDARMRFARSASIAALGAGLGNGMTVALGAGVVVALVTLVSSRLQIDAGGPGVLPVTVPLPALLIFAIAFVAARATGGFRTGLRTGLLALAASFVAVAAVVAAEGLSWMQRHGVFVLDGDPTKIAVTPTEVALDLFATGIWIGHLVFWLPWPVLGAWLGSRFRAADAGPTVAGTGSGV